MFVYPLDDGRNNIIRTRPIEGLTPSVYVTNTKEYLTDTKEYFLIP